MFKFIRVAGKLLGFRPLGQDEDERETKKEENLFIKASNSSTVETANKVKPNFSDEKLANAIFDILETLKKMYKRFEADEIDEEKEIKWKYAAVVMDKIFFIITLFLTVITFASIIMSIPNFYKAT